MRSPIAFSHIGAVCLDADCRESKPVCSGLEKVSFNSSIAFSNQRLPPLSMGPKEHCSKRMPLAETPAVKPVGMDFCRQQCGHSTTFQYAGMRLVHDGSGFEGAGLREFESAYTVQIICSSLARHSGLTLNVHWQAIYLANAFRFQCAVLTSAFRPQFSASRLH